jgi:hypothetical protein
MVKRMIHRCLWWHQNRPDAQPINGWESFIEHSLTHDRVGL